MDEQKNLFVEERSIPIYVIVSILTCGIGSLYWAYQLNEDVKKLNPNITRESWLVVLFMIITCGIYSLYFVYVTCDEVITYKNGKNSNTGSYSPLICLVANLLVTSIVSQAVIQNEINQIVRGNTNSN